MTRVIIRFILFILLAALFGACSRIEGDAPSVSFNRDFKALGSSPSLTLTVADSGTGLSHVTIHLKQKDQDVALADESFNKSSAPKMKTYDVGKLMVDKYKIQDGPATLTVIASDHALRNFLKGNQTRTAKDFQFSVTPPQLEVLSGQHYINQGGSECVVYRVSSNVEVSGVQVGKRFFPGYPASAAPSGGKKLYFALFALQYDEPQDTDMKVIARDAAGNEVTAGFWHKVFPKKFRSRDIPLEDSFIQKVVPEITSHTPDIRNDGDPVQTFVKINSELRHRNHEAIAKFAAQSGGMFLWNGPFLQLSNSKVEAYFADRRTYIYKGKAVDQQDHVGFDLSVVQHNPIEAGNDGKVVYADYFGIYGNAVIIDHGTGLISIYGHMSSIDAKAGQLVKKKDVIGKSGDTGLAGGDHLHFGLFLHGVPVNPTEWWDEKWIKDHVLDRLKEAGVQ
jgi:murein DD-endopeptidase MepM/ murein hydrolase activator NlpD